MPCIVYYHNTTYLIFGIFVTCIKVICIEGSQTALKLSGTC